MGAGLMEMCEECEGIGEVEGQVDGKPALGDCPMCEGSGEIDENDEE